MSDELDPCMLGINLTGKTTRDTAFENVKRSIDNYSRYLSDEDRSDFIWEVYEYCVALNSHERTKGR